LFGGFVGTVSPSDFPSPFVIGLRPPAFPVRPAVPSATGEGGIPCSRAERFCACVVPLTASCRSCYR
jgi:hypothetical protein